VEPAQPSAGRRLRLAASAVHTEGALRRRERRV